MALFKLSAPPFSQGHPPLSGSGRRHTGSLRLLSLGAAAGALLSGSTASAQLAVVGHFKSGVPAVGAGYDHLTASVWIYQDLGSTLRRYSTTGEFLGAVPSPGAAANEADVDVAPEELTLGDVLVPAGSLLFIDSESGTAKIHAVDPGTGALLATLNTSFGASHLVGGAYHPMRDTFFLVHGRTPGMPDDNLVAELDPVTGTIVGIFVITNVRPGFTVNYGDLDVGANGNLLIVSSDEAAIGEFSPLGSFVQEHPLPKGVGSLCGIAYDHTRSEIWVASTDDDVWRMRSGPACTADFNADDAVNSQDFFDFLTAFFGTDPAADFNADNVVNSQDFFDFLSAFFAGC